MKRSHDGAELSNGQPGQDRRRRCPYLDTINRNMLDFDLEKICSVSLSNQNVYMCLVCGKLFQGRGKSTHAYTHSVHAGHHVFINMHNGAMYCLPDLYEVVDSSLDDIRTALRPKFTPSQIQRIDEGKALAHDVFGVAYLPGFVGLNNLKMTDYVNVTIQALAHVKPIRDYFLEASNYEQTCKSQLVLRFGEMMRKLWSPGNFKSTVSPHELVQEINVASNKRFKIGEQNEVISLMSWLLNDINRSLQSAAKKKGKITCSTVVTDTFQGEVEVLTEHEQHGESSAGSTKKEWVATRSPFLFLSLDLPPTPLFKDSQGGNIIPQIPLFNVLTKYDGKHITDSLKAGVRQRKKFRLTRLPRYLIFHVNRFTKNNFFVEKNPTIVNFPVKNLEMKDYVDSKADPSLPSEEELVSLSVSQLRNLLKEHKVDSSSCVEKRDLEELVKLKILGQEKARTSTKYDLVVNICHDSPASKGRNETMDPLAGGSYRVHVLNKATKQWYEIQDLHVQETLPQLIGLSESYLMIYEKHE